MNNTYKILLSALLGSFLTATAIAQTDSTFTYVAGEGTYIRLGKQDGPKFNISSVVQPGIQFGRLDSAGSLTNNSRLSLNLVRVRLQGSALKDKVTFGIMTDFNGTMPILEGWIGFSIINKNTRLILGQKQTNTNNRLAMEDERYAQVMGQSIAGHSNDGIIYGGLMQNFVESSREGGLFFETKFNVNNFKIYPSISVTTGEGQNFFDAQSDLGFKYGGRLDIMPFGDFIKNNAFIAHDIYRETRPRLVLGVAGSYNAKASSPVGTANNAITTYGKDGEVDYASYRKLVVDGMFKYRGFALVGEFINGSITGKELYTNAAATLQMTPEVASTLYNLGKAWNVQGSYVFRNKLVVDARYSKIDPEFFQTGSRVQDQNWYTLGINKYFNYNAMRVGLNATYIDSKTPEQETKKWIGNLAFQIIL